MMGKILQQRLGTQFKFRPGEEAMLALGLAAGDMGSLSDPILHRHDLTHTQYNVLRILRGGGERGLSHGEVTRRLVMKVPDVTRMMDRLLKRSLVSRERASDDRRVVIHRITPSGIELLDRIEPELSAMQDRFADGLGAEDLAELVRHCERVIELVQGGVLRVEGEGS